MRLTLLVTSPRVAPGLLSWGAWQAVAAAGRRLASDPQAPLPRAVAAAGHRVERLSWGTAAELLRLAEHESVVWLAGDEEVDRLPGQLAAALVGAAETGRTGPEVEVLHGSYDLPGARLLDLVVVMDRLRTQCPWDREQTHRSLARYLVEETYETLEAIETGDLAALREELGDLLLQVCFHARIAGEASAGSGAGFDVDDVAGDIVAKLVHRHPHVFAGLEVAGVAEVESNWETLKATEKDRASVLDGVPRALPALALADKVLGRAARVGVGLPAGDRPADDPAAPLGERLLALCLRTRALGLDPEQALRDAVRELADTVRAVEAAR